MFGIVHGHARVQIKSMKLGGVPFSAGEDHGPPFRRRRLY
jgi:hypothetical protein